MQNKSPNYDAVSTFERQYLDAVETIKLRILRPIVHLLDRLGVSPNMISFSQIPLSVILVFILTSNSSAAGIFFIFVVLLDGVDGALAIYSKKGSRFGKMFDPFCDHVREAIIFAALGYHTTLSSFWLAVYVFIHAAFNLATFACNLQKVSLPFAVKPTLVIYPLLWCYLLLDQPDKLGNVIHYGLVISIVYMGVIITQAGMRLRKVLSLPVPTPVIEPTSQKSTVKKRGTGKQPLAGD